jgi:hypothetical protein
VKNKIIDTTLKRIDTETNDLTAKVSYKNHLLNPIFNNYEDLTGKYYFL